MKNKIDKNYNIILDLLYKQEGGVIHRNPSEKDITTSYGIYRYSWADAEVFKYIDKVANNLKLPYDSSSWDKEQISRINEEIDQNLERYYSYVFYQGYFSKLNLEIYPEELLNVACSIYTNSPLIYSKALQNSLNRFVSKGLLEYGFLTVDGKIGQKTNLLVKDLNNLPKSVINEFKNLLIDNCKEQYIKLAQNPKYKKFLNGWLNRCESLR